jgi:hypothetical protein
VKQKTHNIYNKMKHLDHQYESLVSWYYIEEWSDYPGPKGRVVPDAEGYDDPSKYEGTELYIPKGAKGYKEYAGNTSYFTDYEGNSAPFKKEYFKLNPNMTNETLRMQMLSGIITESEYKAKLNENIEQLEDYISNLFDMSVPEDTTGQFNGVWEKSEYADKEAYDDAEEFNKLIQHLKSNGGKATLEGNPNIMLRLLPNGDIKFSANLDSMNENKKPKSKKSLNENFVGIGAINNPFPTRKKSDYELAFDHYMGNINEVEGEEEMGEEEMGNENPIDAITMDVPLFIRMLEFAREDASTDMDLHDLAEKAIAMSAEGEVLSMDNYEDLIGGEKEELDEYGRGKYDRKVGTYKGKYPIYQDDEGNNYIKTGSGIKDVEDLDQSQVKINR